MRTWNPNSHLRNATLSMVKHVAKWAGRDVLHRDFHEPTCVGIDSTLSGAIKELLTRLFLESLIRSKVLVHLSTVGCFRQA